MTDHEADKQAHNSIAAANAAVPKRMTRAGEPWAPAFYIELSTAWPDSIAALLREFVRRLKLRADPDSGVISVREIECALTGAIGKESECSGLDSSSDSWLPSESSSQSRSTSAETSDHGSDPASILALVERVKKLEAWRKEIECRGGDGSESGPMPYCDCRADDTSVRLLREFGFGACPRRGSEERSYERHRLDG